MLLIVWLVSIWAGYAVANRAEKGGLGLALGIFLGPLGVFVAWVMTSDSVTRCAACRKNVSCEATVCPYCRSALAPH